MRRLAPAAALAALLLAPGALRAQAAGSLSQAAPLLDAPGGRIVAQLRKDAPVTRRRVQGDLTLVVVDGWVDVSLLAGKVDTFPSRVAAPSGAAVRLAANPTAGVTAVLVDGTGVTPIALSGKWKRVRRAGWVPTRVLQGAQDSKPVAAASRPAGQPAVAAKPTLDAPRPAPAPAKPAASAPPPVSVTTSAPSTADPAELASLLSTTRRTPLHAAPEGPATATVEARTSVVPIARERGWVKVRVEGWMREGEAEPADTSLRATLSAADLRADPEAARGKVVRWEVEVLALQKGDPLRKDLVPDEPYLLARGPGSEGAILYLAVPPSLLSQARAMAPLTKAVVVARVRSGRSEPVGVPVLDLMSLARR